MMHFPYPSRPLGIFGAVHSAGVAAYSEVFHPAAHSILTSADGKAAIGVTARPIRPRTGIISGCSEDGAKIGFTMGMLFSDSVLENSPYLAGEILANPLPHCNGMFVSAGYAGGKLTLVTSPFGVYPLYYTLQQGGLFFSTVLGDLHAFMDAPARLRTEGVAQWICIERMPDGGTVWEGIERCQAACVYTFDTADGSLNVQRYWEPEFGAETGGKAIERCVDAFASAVHRIAGRAEGKVSAALTGGLDSRIIWSILAGRYPDITGVTHYMNEGTDIALARRLAARLGVRHEACHIGEEFAGMFESSLEALLRSSNGTPSAENAHQLMVYDYHTPWTDTLIDGINVSLERNISMRRLIPANAAPGEAVERTYRWLLNPRLAELLDPEAQKVFAEYSRNAVAGGYARCNAALPAKERADAFQMKWMEPNYRGDLAAMQFQYNTYVTPFFDMDYVAAISRIREDLRSQQVFQRALFKRYAPGLLRMPRSHTDIRTLGVAHWKLQLLPLAWDRYAAAHLARIAPAAWRPRIRLARPSVALHTVFRNYLSANMEAVVRGIPGEFDSKRTAAYLNGFLSGEYTDIAAAGRLIAMSTPWSVLRPAQ